MIGVVKDYIKKLVVSKLRDITFGFADGTVSTLGVITGIASGTGSTTIVMLSGLVVIIVESLSMAAGTFISSKSVRDLQKHMLDEQKEEIEEHPLREQAELENVYKAKGISLTAIRHWMGKITKNEKMFMEEKAYHQLGITPQSVERPFDNAIAMGIAYVIGGIVPLSVYFILPFPQVLPEMIVISVLFSILFLFLVGVGKSFFTKKVWWKSGLESVGVSISVALAGFLIGFVVGKLIGADTIIL